MGAKPKPKPTDLVPVNWPAIKPHYVAGIRSIASIAKEFGVSRPAIDKHALKHGWNRNLAPAIHARADRIVAEVVAAPPEEPVAGFGLQPDIPATPADAAIVEAGAQQLALVKIGHRKDIAALRTIIQGLMSELAETIERPDLFAQVQMVYALTPEDETQTWVQPGALEDALELVRSLPARTKVAKDLADALHKCIGMEREAFGLNTAGGTDGMPLVLVKDFTGKGDADSPFFGKPQPDSEY
jgi:hypothetical protein